MPDTQPKIILPLSTHLKVPPNQPARVVCRPNNATAIERIHISGAGTQEGAADWIVNDVEVNGKSQLKHKDLAGYLFGPSGVASGRGTTSLSLRDFDIVERGHEVVLIVTYVGPNPEGAPFWGAVVGSRPPQRPTVIPLASKFPLPPSTKATITARVQGFPFQMQRLEIDHADGTPDWIVNDLRINGRSQFMRPGPIPGDMFSTPAIDTFIKTETCVAGNAIEIDVTYIGGRAEGSSLKAHLEGTVIREDYTVAPPDLHVRVLVEQRGQGTYNAVVATCNWRAPASDNSTP